MVSSVSGGFNADLLLAYSKATGPAKAITDEQTLKLQQAKAAEASSLPENSTVSRYA